MELQESRETSREVQINISGEMLKSPPFTIEDVSFFKSLEKMHEHDVVLSLELIKTNKKTLYKKLTKLCKEHQKGCYKFPRGVIPAKLIPFEIYCRILSKRGEYKDLLNGWSEKLKKEASFLPVIDFDHGKSDLLVNKQYIKEKIFSLEETEHAGVNLRRFRYLLGKLPKMVPFTLIEKNQNQAAENMQSTELEINKILKELDESDNSIRTSLKKIRHLEKKVADYEKKIKELKAKKRQLEEKTGKYKSKSSSLSRKITKLQKKLKLQAEEVYLYGLVKQTISKLIQEVVSDIPDKEKEIEDKNIQPLQCSQKVEAT